MKAKISPWIKKSQNHGSLKRPLLLVVLRIAHSSIKPGAWSATDLVPDTIFFFSNDTITYYEISDRCPEISAGGTGRAVSILSREENNIINYQLFPYNQAKRGHPAFRWHWTGLHRESPHRYNFAWYGMGQEGTTFTNWQKNGPGENAFMALDFLDGRWSAQSDKTRSRRYICQNVNPCLGYCVNNGTCELDEKTGARATTQCKCPRGWTGQRCQDEGGCVDGHCVNGGTCMQFAGISSPSCVCPPEFTGSRCESDVDECHPTTGVNNCNNLNTHRCNNIIGNYTCDCRAGFTGDTCSQQILGCRVSTCANGGTCREGVNGVECQCPPGFAGPHCEHRDVHCLSAPCQNGGECREFPNGYTCHCPESHKGDRCHVDVDECSELGYCPGVACINEPGSYRCDCPAYFTGPMCNDDLDECAITANPCFGRGHCVNVQGADYRCDCQAGYDPATHCAVPLAACDAAAAAASGDESSDNSARSTSTTVAICVVIIAQFVVIVGLVVGLLRQSPQTTRTPTTARQV